MTAVALLVAVVLLAANAFFTAVEFALVAASRSRLEVLAEAGNRRARLAVRAMGDLGIQLAGAQLGLTMTALGLGFVVEPAVARLLDPLLGGFGHGASVAVAIAIVVFAHVLLGEMVPKNAALCNPDGLAMWLAPAHRLFVGAFRPAIRSLEWMVAALVRLCGVAPVDRTSSARTPAELSDLLARSRADGLLGDFEHSLLASALELGERPVSSVMVPRERIVSIPRSASVAEAERTVVRSGHSRLLMGDVDRPDGFVHAKDLLAVSPGALERGAALLVHSRGSDGAPRPAPGGPAAADATPPRARGRRAGRDPDARAGDARGRAGAARGRNSRRE